MRINYKIRYPYAIPLDFGDNFLTSLTKLVIQVKASICSAIKENPVLYCCKFSAFVVVVII